MSALKRLFKVDTPPAIEVIEFLGTNIFLTQNHTLSSAKKLKLWESLSLRVGAMARSVFQIFIFKIDYYLETKGTVLNSFSILHLMLIREKGCAIRCELIQKVQHFLQHRSIYHGALFQSAQVEECHCPNDRDIIVG